MPRQGFHMLAVTTHTPANRASKFSNANQPTTSQLHLARTPPAVQTSAQPNAPDASSAHSPAQERIAIAVEALRGLQQEAAPAPPRVTPAGCLTHGP
eukprot:3322751-Rhodomonas_salina.3